MARSNLNKSDTVDTETKKRLEDEMCLQSHERTLRTRFFEFLNRG